MNSISRQMAMVKFYVRRIYHNLKVFAKWAVFSSITGLVVGAFSTLFAECLKLVTQFRTANPWMILLLPLVGIVIVFLYHIFHYKNDKGTNMVLSTIHAETELPFKNGTAYLYFYDPDTLVWRLGRARRCSFAVGRKYR